RRSRSSQNRPTSSGTGVCLPKRIADRADVAADMVRTPRRRGGPTTARSLGQLLSLPLQLLAPADRLDLELEGATEGARLVRRPPQPLREPQTRSVCRGLVSGALLAAHAQLEDLVFHFGSLPARAVGSINPVGRNRALACASVRECPPTRGRVSTQQARRTRKKLSPLLI